MKNSILEFKVQYADTDAYQVAWHGSYLRWMEAGRVDLLYKNGVDIKKLDEERGIVMPVVEVNIKYKQSAKLMDDIVVETNVIEKNNIYVIFEQIIKSKEGKIFTEAHVKGLGIQNGKIMRNLGEIFGD